MRLQPDAVHVWPVSVHQTPAGITALRRVLTEAERARADAYALADDCRRAVVARGVLRCLLGACLAVPPDEVRFRRGPNGKLLLDTDRPIPLHFNVSHSGDLVLIALSRGGPIGVDVERIRDGVDIDSVAARFFAPAEASALAALTPAARRDAFFAIWVRKEAYIKARGSGLARPLHEFTVSVDPAALQVDLTEEKSGVVNRWTIRSVAVGEGYAAAVAFEGRMRVIESRGLRLSDCPS